MSSYHFGMAREIYNVLLEKISILTPTIRELKIKLVLPDKLNFQAGQFIIIHVPQSFSDNGKVTRRAYSIASTHHTDQEITLIIKIVPNGISSSYIKTLNDGDTINLSGPFGKLFFEKPKTKNILLISTGAGISQHFSFLASHSKDYPKVHFRCLIGVWNEDEILYNNELETIKNNSQFEFEFILDQAPNENWPGKTGHVTNHLNDYINLKNLHDTTVYLCGNPQMIKSVKAKLSTMNFPEDSIFAEAF